jgi:hypothetical protein
VEGRMRTHWRSFSAEDEWLAEPRETCDVIVEESTDDTGLVDQYGVTIRRVRRPIGFCKEVE